MRLERRDVRTKTFLLCIALVVAAANALRGDSATWNPNPVSNEWGLATNWTPAIIPFGETAIATFGASNVTNLTVSSSGQGNSDVIVGGITFTPDAGSYALTVIYGSDSQFLPFIEFTGAGVTNNSGTIQKLVAANNGDLDPSRIYFEGD